MGFAEWLNEFLYVDQRQEIKAAEDQRIWFLQTILIQYKNGSKSIAPFLGTNKRRFMAECHAHDLGKLSY